MKLTPALTLLALATPALAQTAKPPVHHAPVHRATAACADTPVLSPEIPKIPGCPKTLYALKYIDTLIGTGPLAEPMKLYTVHYTGYLLDGKKFDSSLDRKEPITFPVGLHRVITGWDTGFAGMHVGGKRRLFIPYQLAYGDAGRPPVIPAKAVLIFDLELLDQKDLPQQPQQAPGQPRPTPPAAAPAQPKPTTPPASSAPAPAPGAIPTPPPATAPGSAPGTAPKPTDPTKPTTVPPPTDPTKPATTPPSTTPTPSAS